jgi:hypothetical protein
MTPVNVLHLAAVRARALGLTGGRPFNYHLQVPYPVMNVPGIPSVPTVRISESRYTPPHVSPYVSLLAVFHRAKPHGVTHRAEFISRPSPVSGKLTRRPSLKQRATSPSSAVVSTGLTKCKSTPASCARCRSTS